MADKSKRARRRYAKLGGAARTEALSERERSLVATIAINARWKDFYKERVAELERGA